MVSRIDSSDKKKIIFKKRAHRPWKPAILETVMQNAHAPKSYEAEIELLHLELEETLEETLEHKTRERDSLNLKLSLHDDHRITIGGFLQPKKVVFSNDESTSKQTSTLMNDLREKEQEILALTTNLKVSQALEQAQHAESTRLAEIKAREAAEEKAVYALSKAQQAADYSKLAEERAYIAEQAAFKHEQTIQQLQDTLQRAAQQYQDNLEHTTKKYDASLEIKTNGFIEQLQLKEQMLNAQFQVSTEAYEEKLRVSAQEHHSLNEAFQDLLHNFESTHLQLSAAYTDIEDLKGQFNKKIMVQSEQIYNLEHSLTFEKNNTASLEGEIASLHEKRSQLLQDKATLETQLIRNSEYLRKMSSALNLERNLRTLFEEKAREATLKAFDLEMQNKAEGHARKSAEEKAKQTLQQAGKAVMQLLNVPTP